MTGHFGKAVAQSLDTVDQRALVFWALGGRGARKSQCFWVHEHGRSWHEFCCLTKAIHVGITFPFNLGFFDMFVAKLSPIAMALVLISCQTTSRGRASSQVFDSESAGSGSQAADRIECVVKHSEGSGDSSERYSWAVGPQEFVEERIIDQAKVNFEFDPQSQVAKIRFYSNRSQLGGQVSALLEAGMSAGIFPINDYDFGDGSNSEIECKRSGTFNQPLLTQAKATCTSIYGSNPLITKSEALNSSGAASISGGWGELAADIQVLSGKKSLSVWPYSDEHGGFSVSGYTTKKQPLALEKGGELIKCWLE